MLTSRLESPNELPVYNWHPSVLTKVNASAEHLARLLQERIASAPADEPEQALLEWINTELVRARLGITDALEVELSALASNPDAATTLFARMLSIRARVGWTTHGHTGVDVNIYCSGGDAAAAADIIRGNVENTDVGRFLSEYLDVDVDEITRELERKLVARGEAAAEKEALWQGDPYGHDEVEMDGHPVAWLGEVAGL